MTIGLRPLRLGIDLGGTKTEIIALGPGGDELLRRRVDTPRSYPGTLDLLSELVADAEAALGARGTVGIGIPGALSPETGRVKNANSTWLIGRALDADLGSRLGRPVRLMNDANCFALSEASDGAGAGASSVFGVILGTGVGGGVVLNGRVHPGAGLVAGEWGHNPLPVAAAEEFPGPPCYCGRRGCVETWLSGPGMAADHLRVTGETFAAEEIALRATAGNAAAAGTLARYTERLGRALAVVVNILDPEVVVLGGGVSNIPGLPARAREALAPHVFTDTVVTRVVANAHGDSSGVRGAAWL
ncbi:MAG TPA: ROK family protein, partial [Longimicrobiales bacterium]|nr:ROK family protein [Longimicrobiales bacterium]